MRRTPVASGSSVPECPTFLVCRMPRSLATTSWEGHPASLSTTTNPSGIGIVVAELVESAQHFLDACRLTLDGIRLEGKQRSALDAGLASDGLLERDAVFEQPLEHLLVAIGASRSVDVHRRVTEIGFHLDTHHRDEVEALVVDPFQLLGDDLMQQLVEPGRARISTRRAHASDSIHSRDAFTTSTSGNDDTNRSTASRTSRTCDSVPETAAKPNVARCHLS